MDNTIRLNKYLAHLGLTSRRSTVEILKKDRVTINGKRAMEPGIRLNPKKDKVLINGKEVKTPEFIYLILNKPKGVLSTASDELGRKDVVSMVNSQERLYPVGRLDKDSQGLILLTNDGELANKLTHPRYHTAKTYEVLIKGNVSENKLNKLKNGVKLKDGLTSPSKIRVLGTDFNNTLLEMTLFEGKNRQIRRMCSALFLELISLKRVAIGNLKMGNLKVGEFRQLTEKEISLLNDGRGERN